MSVRIMTAVWNDGMRYEGGELLVLLALADWANDEGWCFPGVAAIARKSRLTERQVYNVLARLRTEGAIEVVGGRGRGNLTRFRVVVSALAGPRVEPVKGEIISVKPDAEKVKSATRKPEICDTENLKFATKKGEICDTPPDPLFGVSVKEPSREPSGANSPYPLAGEGVAEKSAKQVHVTPRSFGRFRLVLKASLADAPLRSPNFGELVPGEWDFNACFREWWLVDAVVRDGVTVVRTESAAVEVTQRGLVKYRARIGRLAREQFGAEVEFEVAPAAARVGMR